MTPPPNAPTPAARRVLIVSPHFPPTNAPDCQRVRTSLAHYAAFGWEPVVLAVNPRRVRAPIDRRLLALLPSEAVVHRCGALPASLGRLVGIGNIAYRAWWPLRAAGERLLRAERFDLVFFSTTQYIATLLGERWRARTGVPYVVDIQDPWRTDAYERPGAPPPPGGWKYRVARRQANRLEERAWSGAAGFVSVSPAYLEQLRQRYPWFASRLSAVIPFGASVADFHQARQSYDPAPAIPVERGKICCASVGAVGPVMRDAIEHLFSAVRQLKLTHPEAVTHLRFHFVGTSYAPGRRAEPSVLPVAEAFGLSGMVREEPRRVGYFSALDTMLAADALVIPSSADPGYNPSKLAGCFLAQKPTLCLAPPGSELERHALELGIGPVARVPAPPGDSAAVDFLQALVTGGSADLMSNRREERFEAEYTARARTRQQCELFDRCLAGGSTPK